MSDEYRKALERVGSCNAFGVPHVIPDSATGREVKDRMEFARLVLAGVSCDEAERRVVDARYAESRARLRALGSDLP